MRYRLISLSDKEAWDKALTFVPHVYTHTHWYNQAMATASKRNVFLYTAEAGDFRVVCPISPRQKHSGDPFDITTPYGFSGFASVGEYGNFCSEWHAHMREQNYVCGHIALNPTLQTSTLYSAAECFSGKKTYYLDLSPPAETIYQQFSTDHRHRLRQWQRNKPIIRMDKTAQLIDIFHRLYTASLVERGAAAIYNFGLSTWEQIINSPHSYLFSTLENDEVSALALFISYDDIADYFMIASSRDGRLHARGLIWEASLYFKEKGLRWLHLGCGVRENDALEEFKARFGAQPRVTHALKQIYNPTCYQMLCDRNGTNSENLNGYFPSYWDTTHSQESLAI